MTPDRSGRVILPLPPDVVAQIKSSTTIVSLTGVVLELLKNSLDGRATNVEATVDFARGACTVEDDGLGIAPPEFREDGGLGKLYCTSKHHAHEALLGCNGTFLASLSAVSLLSITSRHHQHRSHNSLTFHHGSAIERQIPALSRVEIHGKHGTRVTVRNLFGNLPVRVKQRSLVLEQKTAHGRLCNLLKSSVAGVLLSWGGPVSLRLRDADNHVVLAFNTSDCRRTAHTAWDEQRGIPKPRPTFLTCLLTVLTQASYISVDEWASWVPVTASTPTLSVRGAISLDPAPTRSIQFISLGIQPLLPDAEHNELYDLVNRLFRLSDFGTIEDDADTETLDKIRTQSAPQCKGEGYISRQSKARKGIDRHPMFHLRISPRERRQLEAREIRFMEDKANLQTVVEVLTAMITQWLSAHRFRPGGARKHKQQNRGSSTSCGAAVADDNIIPPRYIPGSEPVEIVPPATGATMAEKRIERSGKRRLSAALGQKPPKPAQNRAFAEWSGIKSGKTDFFDTFALVSKPSRHTAMPNADSDIDYSPKSPKSCPTALPTTNSTGWPKVRSAPAAQLPQGDQHDQASAMKATVENSIDNTILWTDPAAKRTHVINARTGCVMAHACARPVTGLIASTSTAVGINNAEPSRLTVKESNLELTPWLGQFLESWDNPIFAPSEKRITQVSLHDHELSQKLGKDGSHQCLNSHVIGALADVPVEHSDRLSREGLVTAETIAQLDRKLILVKLKRSQDVVLPERNQANMLVLIDQHAADERVQVEALYKQLCTPVVADRQVYRSRLGQRAQVASTVLTRPVHFSISDQEQSHFVAYAARFAAWGILYDAVEGAQQRSTKADNVLSVLALPPIILERCRADSTLLISFLRSTVWEYASDVQASSLTSTDISPDWVRKLATCPRGLLDLVNSRACRSAIMFNDELTLPQCKELIQKLAGCAFPFICAHGRPSMVPLVGLGRNGVETSHLGPVPALQHDGFAQAWKRWRS
ncbi:hypothetical protein EK21DRAFT_76356 [Setomelanomma holmii]|uniref:MutL C-terminal dimerisation domain-containing protein n=1 Tax=Setomelanomma holmii TaxID=210430 RepID=A0A9P4H2F0_9PLEO|nr:hypothetical protein EK21DRAFT_76356 [Setomelanomma holmii]